MDIVDKESINIEVENRDLGSIVSVKSSIATMQHTSSPDLMKSASLAKGIKYPTCAILALSKSSTTAIRACRYYACPLEWFLEQN